MRIKIVHVGVETAGSGRKTYEIAEVSYDVNGNKKVFKVFSFLNPAVFKTVSTASSGDEFDVTVTKNDKGYDQWAAITPSSGDSAPSAAPSATGSKATATNYGDRETKEERAQRQVLIVKQSSLSAAINTLSVGSKSALDPKVVIDLAQQYTDWVFEQQKEDIFGESFPSDPLQ